MFLKNTQIYYLENFLTKEEIDFFLSRASSFKVPESLDMSPRWALISERIHPILFEDEYGTETLLDGMYERLCRLCYEVLDMRDDYVIQRISHFNMMYPPLSMKPHWDGTTPGVHYGIVIYVSEPDDYEGGEISYVNKQISIKPASGSIVIHPATEEYEHGVELLESGLRIAMTSFIQELEYVGGPGNQDGSEEVRR